MARGPSENLDLELVQDLIFSPRLLKGERFSHAETVAGRTPDFRVKRNDQLVAFCEVKSPRDDWLDDQLAVAAPGQIVGGARSDPTFNRIARHVQKAATQFDAVNSTRVVPNILVFVNHADASHYDDLRETLTGMFYAENGECYVTMPHISDGLLAEAKRRIDLYIWIDVPTRYVEGYIFNQEFTENVEKLCEMLALDASKIKT